MVVHKRITVFWYVTSFSLADRQVLPTFRRQPGWLQLILHSPAYEDGTDRGFRNVGFSDAGELPKRKHTTIYLLLSASLYQTEHSFQRVLFS